MARRRRPPRRCRRRSLPLHERPTRCDEPTFSSSTFQRLGIFR
jgi:hypothetical protein